MPRQGTYARLYGDFEGHPKRRRVSLAADGLWARALSRAVKYETDGWVEDSWVREQVPSRQRAAVLAEVKRERMLEPLPAGKTIELVNVGSPLAGQRVTVGPFSQDGWVVHDFLEHQLSKAQIAEIRRLATARARRARSKPAAAVSRVMSRVRHASARARTSRQRENAHVTPAINTNTYSFSLGGSRKDRRERGRADARRSESTSRELSLPLMTGMGWAL